MDNKMQANNRHSPFQLHDFRNKFALDEYCAM